jgi:hypothetical protein
MDRDLALLFLAVLAAAGAVASTACKVCGINSWRCQLLVTLLVLAALALSIITGFLIGYFIFPLFT